MTGPYFGVEIAAIIALFFVFDYFAEEGSSHTDPPATKLAVLLLLAVTYPIVFALRRVCFSRPPDSAFNQSFDLLVSTLTGLLAGGIVVGFISMGFGPDDDFSPTTKRVIFSVVGLITMAVSFTEKNERRLNTTTGSA